MKAETGCRYIAAPNLKSGGIWGWVMKVTPRLLYPQERAHYSCTEVCMGSSAILDECSEEKMSVTSGFRTRARQ
jgi:hypothetical protein